MGNKDARRITNEAHAAYLLLMRAPAEDKPRLYIRCLAAERRVALRYAEMCAGYAEGRRYYYQVAFRKQQEISAAKTMRKYMEDLG